jgi:hypothetical protein
MGLDMDNAGGKDEGLSADQTVDHLFIHSSNTGINKPNRAAKQVQTEASTA